MTRFLILSILFIGCLPARPVLLPAEADVTCIKKFITDFQSTWYTTSVDVVGQHFSGLLLVKKLEDASQRIVFTNEAGVKFFDFGFDANGEFTIYQILKKLNKPALINTFRRDFELMLMLKAKVLTPTTHRDDKALIYAFESGKEADYVITSANCSQLIRLEKWGRKEKMVEITFAESESIPDAIQIHHFNFNMTIKMKKIIR